MVWMTSYQLLEKCPRSEKENYEWPLEVQIFEIFGPRIFFEKFAKAKRLKLESFAWSHWIRKCLNYKFMVTMTIYAGFNWKGY